MTTMEKLKRQDDAQWLEDFFRKNSKFKHLSVKAHGKHLIISMRQARENFPCARLTALGNKHYGLSLMRHTGRWEDVPFSGLLPDVVKDLIDYLGFYLEKWP